MADGVVEQFLQCMTDHDWVQLAAYLDEDFMRVGPYGDTYPSKPDYCAFISDLMPRLPGYAMEVARVTYGDGVAYAELTETVTVDGRPLRTPECLTFALTDAGLISRIDVFIQTEPPAA